MDWKHFRRAIERAHFPTFGRKAKNHYDPNEGFSAYLAYDYRTRKDWPKTDQAESFLGQLLLVRQSTFVNLCYRKLNTHDLLEFYLASAWSTCSTSLKRIGSKPCLTSMETAPNFIVK